MKKLLSEVPVLVFGASFATAGVSLAFIGADAIKKNWYAGGVVMTFGVAATHIGFQIAMGATERIRGLR